LKKEAYAFVASFIRLDWLLKRPDGFSFFRDHQNLTYIFHPHGQIPSLSAHTAAKLTRWAIKLSSYRYTIEHVPGSDNLWSDMLTRWGAPIVRARVSAVMIAPLSPALEADFEWPSPSEIRRLQDSSLALATSSSPADSVSNISLGSEGLYQLPSGAVWIPSDECDLQLRICIVAHTCIGGHRGFQTTLDTIQSKFSWSTMRADINHSVTVVCTVVVPSGVIAPPSFGRSYTCYRA
jgi:RNase H-like domain found in reverse transcriptase/Integrase zinc binding domain